MLSSEDRAKIQARTDAATGEAWHWAGNTDTGEPYLATWLSGWGRCQVMSIGSEERTADGREADKVRSTAREFDLGDPEELVEEWMHDASGGVISDPRLSFMSDDVILVDARNLAIYEVAPNALTRDDPKVYRADVVGIRHPDAEFIAHARTDIPKLLAELTRIEQALDREGLAGVLVSHNWESRGMSYGSPDGCSCGAKTLPEPGEDDVTIRRARAFAAHQTRAIRTHVLGDNEGKATL